MNQDNEQPDEASLEALRFRLTGKFGKEAHDATLTRAAYCLLLVLDDFNEPWPIPDSELDAMAMTAKLPDGKSLKVLLWLMQRLNWIATIPLEGMPHVELTPQGKEKAAYVRRTFVSDQQ